MIFEINVKAKYSRTSHKLPSQLSSLGGRLRELNLVPRVSHLIALGGKMRDPGNEVDESLGPTG